MTALARLEIGALEAWNQIEPEQQRAAKEISAITSNRNEDGSEGLAACFSCASIGDPACSEIPEVRTNRDELCILLYTLTILALEVLDQREKFRLSNLYGFLSLHLKALG
jgi:hypothetical protein